MASALSGPVMDSLLSTSLTGMLSVLQTTLKTVIFGPPECNRATAVAMAANGGGAGGQIFAPVPPLHDPDDVDVEEQLIGFQLPNLHPESHKTHIIPSAGGVGLSTSTEDAVMRYYCSIKLRICKDFGPLTEGFVSLVVTPRPRTYLTPPITIHTA